ncbi:Sulfurtransferase TusE [Serratia symbiotica]|nr:Sulfurtransferase TusE [Serratia symbiotica]
MIIYNNKIIKTDSKGYLENISDWNENLAIKLANKEGIILTDIHWELIFFIRNFYKKFNTSPTMRMLVKSIEEKYGKKIGNTRYLYYLFPKGPAKQATKIAGLPKPVKCI